jgi:hypothetical protein
MNGPAVQYANGSGGQAESKGVPGEWRLYRVSDSGS